MPRSNTSIYAALISNIGIAITKFIAGAFSRSSAMISEGIHSLVDCFNELILLLGIKKSAQKRDELHPFGYGRDLYFWSFIVAVLIFGLGSGISFYQGYIHLKNPSLTKSSLWNYVVLAISFLFDGISFLIALSAFNKLRKNKPFWKAILESKDPSTFMILLEDGASVIGVCAVCICLVCEQLFHNPYLDGIASVIIGILLLIVSIILARESRSLLLGEGISKKSELKISRLVKNEKEINNLERIFSIYQSPDEVLIVLLVSFKENLTTKDINETIQRLQQIIRREFEKINYIIIEPWSKPK
jgi:cation diffusion facilitator family transporter